MKNLIVITGGAGFIGSHLIEIFLKKTSKKIVSIDNYKYGSKKNEIKSNRVEYINGNTKNISNLLKKYKKKIDTVFHFGEYARIHQSFKDFEECISSNVGGTSEVLNFCLKNKIRIIYSATSATLGNKGNDQYLSPYAFTKARNLKTILQLNAWFGLRYEIMYFYNVYGKRHISEGNMATVIGIFENHYLKKKPLPVVKPGTQSRKFTHIDDTIDGCFFAWKKNKNRHYSLANNKSLKIIKVAKLFSNRIKYLKPRLGERYKSVVTNRISNQKIYSLECKKSLQEYISKFKQENNR
tara:strand:+ start:495 stop:1382 length:888 start_codon:yes stop_codon:yes gene_type:complete